MNDLHPPIPIIPGPCPNLCLCIPRWTLLHMFSSPRSEGRYLMQNQLHLLNDAIRSSSECILAVFPASTALAIRDQSIVTFLIGVPVIRA